MKALLPVLAALAIAASSPAATAFAADEVPTLDAATSLLNSGHREEALQAFERIAASHPPDPTDALFGASSVALDLDRWREAKPYVRQLVKLRPASMQAWELQVQVDQAGNDKSGLKEAMGRLDSAWRSALDPAIRSRVSFVRDRIFGPKLTLLASQTLDPGGDEIIRWVFQPAATGARPSHYLILHSDGETNERWRDSGAVQFGTNVFHLDAVSQLRNGRAAVVPYKFYVEEPDYDEVRKLVASILTGEAKPLSGDPDPFWTGGAGAN
jgi:tetratricopeptide (TPR) repeat protein